ncbi:unnamed protein product [Lathyrus sativus]|nr:unnamed protein product [Lathyrus sativus]
MANIRVISKTTIKATNDEDKSIPKMIDLTPWDLKYLKIHQIQLGLLFHKPKTDQIQHLKQTLSSTLNLFPPLAGRLVITQDEHDPNKASCSIICNNVGALFVHVTAENTTIADIIQPKYVPPIVQSLFPLNGVKNYQGTSQPLLAVQVTELVDGIFIGIDINHLAVDAKSFWFFVNSWAEISNGFNKPTEILSFHRWFPNNIDPPIWFPFTKQVKNQQCEDSPHQIFHFTKEQILQLKSKANAEIGNSNNNIVISSLQALISHIWILIISKHHFEPEEDVICVFPIDCRTRVFPKLADTYFGNAIGAVGVVRMKVGKLMEGGIGRVAVEMNKVLSTESHHEKVLSNYESWLKTPFILEPSETSTSRVLVVVNSPRLNFYGNDFGWGKPVAVRNGNGLEDNTGEVIVLGGEEEGSIDLELCLPCHILEAMENEMHAITASPTLSPPAVLYMRS